jgi:hypothetical protein
VNERCGHGNDEPCAYGEENQSAEGMVTAQLAKRGGWLPTTDANEQ